MTLPHLPPIRFAKKIIAKENETAEVLCEFPIPPTLPMLLEAAAQSSAAFNEGVVREGMLVGASDVTLHQSIQSESVSMHITKEIHRGPMAIFSFWIPDHLEGKVTLYVS